MAWQPGNIDGDIDLVHDHTANGNPGHHAVNQGYLATQAREASPRVPPLDSQALSHSGGNRADAGAGVDHEDPRVAIGEPDLDVELLTAGLGAKKIDGGPVPRLGRGQVSCGAGTEA